MGQWSVHAGAAWMVLSPFCSVSPGTASVTVELVGGKRTNGSGSFDTFLRLIDGHSVDGAGRVRAASDDIGDENGSYRRDSRVEAGRLPAGKYTLEASASAYDDTGAYRLDISAVTVHGLSSSLHAPHGQTTEFVFEYRPANAEVAMAGDVGADVTVSAAAGSGVLKVTPDRPGSYLAVVAITPKTPTATQPDSASAAAAADAQTDDADPPPADTGTAPTVRVVPAGKACAPGRTVIVVIGRAVCTGPAAGQVKIVKPDGTQIPARCVADVSLGRWHLDSASWPAATACTVSDGAASYRAQFYVLRVPHDDAQVTIRLWSDDRDTYLALYRAPPDPRSIDTGDVKADLGGTPRAATMTPAPTTATPAAPASVTWTATRPTPGSVSSSTRAPTSSRQPPRPHRRAPTGTPSTSRSLTPRAPMTPEPPAAPDDTGPASSAARKPMSRRRFLAVVGGTAGAAGIAGLAGRSLLGGPSSPAPPAAANPAGLMPADPGVEIVEVEPGFADAAVWNDQLLTLRADPAGTGIVLRSETDGAEHPVDAPPDFTARCIGTIDDTLIIGGHRLVNTGSLVFELGMDYEELLQAAGHESVRLRQQPHRPVPFPHRHTFMDHLSTAISTEDLRSWDYRTLEIREGTGGSISGVFESSGTLGIDYYAFAEIPDSIAGLAVVDASSARSGTAEINRLLPIDHGSLWGVLSTEWDEVVIVSDVSGTRGYTSKNQIAFTLEAHEELLGASVWGEAVHLSVIAADGHRVAKTLVNGDLIEVDVESVEANILNQISRDLVVSSVLPPVRLIDTAEAS
ncbi:hypothetical protein [Candidatus Poriferisodalis sp.]|uniref:hypothetical protein n=1 Tax=Candidatus Poriferisodalis sp. TaxID=3101277 RepID=UPI003B5A1678